MFDQRYGFVADVCAFSELSATCRLDYTMRKCNQRKFTVYEWYVNKNHNRSMKTDLVNKAWHNDHGKLLP